MVRLYFFKILKWFEIQFPIIFKQVIFFGAFLVLLHFLNTARIKRTIEHLNDMETVKNYLSIRRKLLIHDVIVVIKIHSYSFDVVSYCNIKLFELVDFIFLKSGS